MVKDDREIEQSVFIENLKLSQKVDTEESGPDSLNDTFEYFNEIEKDLDVNDLRHNEVKLRKLYNLVHEKGIPSERLSKITQKKFIALENILASQSPWFH